MLSPDLSTPSTTTSGGGGDLLVDVFEVEPVALPPALLTADAVSPGAEEGYNRFLTRSNGVLFENDMLQIGVKSQFKKNIGMCSYVRVIESIVRTLYRINNLITHLSFVFWAVSYSWIYGTFNVVCVCVLLCRTNRGILW